MNREINKSSETFKELHSLLSKRLNKIYNTNMNKLNYPSFITSKQEHLMFKDIIVISEAAQILQEDDFTNYKINEKLKDLIDVLNEKLNKGFLDFKGMIDTQLLEEAEEYRTCLEAIII